MHVPSHLCVSLMQSVQTPKPACRFYTVWTHQPRLASVMTGVAAIPMATTRGRTRTRARLFCDQPLSWQPSLPRWRLWSECYDDSDCTEATFASTSNVAPSAQQSSIETISSPKTAKVSFASSRAALNKTFSSTPTRVLSVVCTLRAHSTRPPTVAGLVQSQPAV